MDEINNNLSQMSADILILGYCRRDEFCKGKEKIGSYVQGGASL